MSSPKKNPVKHALLLLLVGGLTLGAFIVGHLLDGLLAADSAYLIPILVAAFFLGPIETLAAGLVSMMLELITEAHTLARDSGDLWTAVGVGGFGALAALTSMQIRRFLKHIGAARESLASSPLAYAEFGFPGYPLRGHNHAFRQLMRSEGCETLAQCLPAETAEELSFLMDRAISTRTRQMASEQVIRSEDGRNSYWNISLIPSTMPGRSTPRSISMFALDVTGAVHRGRTRDAALRISSAVMSSLNLEETLRVVIDSLAYIVGANAGALFLIEDGHWIGAAGWGESGDEEIRRLRLRYDSLPIAVEALETKQAVAIEDARTDDRASQGIREKIPPLDFQSGLAVPLVTGNRRIGVVWLLETNRVKSFTDEQIEFAAIIGAQAALAIDNASAYESEHMMRKSLEAIEAVSEAGLTSLDLNEVLNELVTRTQDVTQMDAAMILLVDSSGEFLQAQATAGRFGEASSDLRLRIGEGLAGRAFGEGVTLKIDDITGHEDEICPDGSYRGGSCPFSEKHGIRSVLAVPIRIGGKVAGVLQLGSGHEGAFAAHEWGLIQVLADRASLAVQNSLLHNETSQELTRVALLHDVAAACAAGDDIRSIAETALEAIYRQLGCDLASIFHFDREKDALVNVAFLGHSREVMDAIATIRMDQDTFLTKAMRTHAVVTDQTHPSSEASQTEAFILHSLGAEDNRRAAVPFIYKGKAVGGMALAFSSRGIFTTSELDVLKSIANQLAVAFHNSGYSAKNKTQLTEQFDA